MFAVLAKRGVSLAVVPLASPLRHRRAGDVPVSTMGHDDAVAVCGSVWLSTMEFEDMGIRLSRADLDECVRVAARHKREAQSNARWTAFSEIWRDAVGV
jgi:hypothetical protein